MSQQMNQPTNKQMSQGLNHLTVQNLDAHHHGVPVLRGIDLQVAAGSITVIVGPNGCGKSTLLRCIARLHRPSAGQVRIGGHDVWAMKSAQAARRIALLPQAPLAPGAMLAAELVRYGRHPHQGWLRQWSREDERAVHAALAATGTLELAARPLEQLSGGQRQRCWLAMALAQDTPLLLLDEPTSMLDIGHQVEVLERVRALADTGRTVVMVLHDLAAAARYADTLVALQDGRIAAAGAPATVLTGALVRQLYGIDAEILRAPGDGAPLVVPTQQSTRKPWNTLAKSR